MRYALAALAALPIAFASIGAQAQTASYCGGKIAANAFYSNVISNGSRSTVVYFAQLQNRTGQSVNYHVAFDGFRRLSPPATNTQSGTEMATLTSYQQVTVNLGQQSFNNPTGTGGLNQGDIARYVTVACP